MNKKFDFSGYATKNDIKCSDGRTIKKDAFKDQDGIKVPLVWQHLHNEPANVLGHAYLENREDGMYTYASFNDSAAGQNAKQLVMHGDITALSIYANQLEERSKNVIHGFIREVSLVMSGANPGAYIDNLSFAHADGTSDTDDTEAIIYTGLDIETAEVQHADTATEDATVQEIFDTLSPIQKDVVYAMISEALGDKAPDEGAKEDDLQHSIDGGTTMKKSVFNKAGTASNVEGGILTHAQFAEIQADAIKNGSYKSSFLAHAVTYGIENIDLLFPDAETLTNTPSFISRDMTWVQGVLSGVHKSPFSRIKSIHADITEDEARAKGYVKGSLKIEEFFGLTQRITTPTTVYKKQKLDRDDIIDITDFDVIAWMKSEMRLMLDEELARAILVGDGRAAGHADKIKEANIRPIWKDDALYSHHEYVAFDRKIEDVIDDIVRARKNYKGSGNPKLYTYASVVIDMLLVKDTTGRRIYATTAELCSALGVSDIVEVPVMENLSRVVTINAVEKTVNLLAIMVNLKDYNVGADKGGQVSMFDDFDIDYNQQKYLMETRCSGALVMLKSAVTIERLPEVVGG